MTSLQQLLSQAGIAVREQGTNVGRDFINICCPFCEETRFHCGIHETDYWFKCFVCGEGGHWRKMGNMLAKLHKRIDWQSLPQDSKRYTQEVPVVHAFKRPVYWREITDRDTRIVEWVHTPPVLQSIHEKFRQRGVDIDIALEAGLQIGTGKLNGYVVFKDGNNINARKFTKDANGPRWWKYLEDSPFLFGDKFAKIRQPEIGVITEGVFDCLRLPFGTGVAILGSAVSDAMIGKIAETFSETAHLVLAMDRDANKNALMKMELMLRDVGFKVTKLDWDEVAEKHIKDIDELYLTTSREEFFNIVGIPDAALSLL